MASPLTNKLSMVIFLYMFILYMYIEIDNHYQYNGK